MKFKQLALFVFIASLSTLAVAQPEGGQQNGQREGRMKERMEKMREKRQMEIKEDGNEGNNEEQGDHDNDGDHEDHAEDGESMEFDSLEQKASYTYGVRNARAMKAQGLELDFEAYRMGFETELSGGKVMMDDAEMREVSRELAAKRREAAELERSQATEKNLKEANEFLAENKTKEGVVTTESGLQYKVIREGEGDSPSATDTVSVHYEGRLLNGTVFDSSYTRNSPSSFAANRVIAGWTEALQLMKPGAEYELYIPPALAYGEQGRPSIPSNSLLIFKVELIEVQ